MTQELAHLNTDIAHQGQLTQTRTETGVSAIEAEVQVIQQAAKVVPTLIDGGMVPDAYSPTFSPRKGAPAQGRDVAIAKAMSAAVYGATIGFGVSKSLQNVFTVHGMPAVYARTMVAQVQSYGHRVWTVESGPSQVTVSAQRRGSEHIETSTWTIERAAQAGFTNNAKYKSQPEEMLWAKAAATVCRRAFADVLEGIPYTVEDLELEPVKMTATRTDGERGADAVRAALAAKKTEPEPEPQDGNIASIEAAESVEALGDVMLALQQQVDQETFEGYAKVADKRAAQLRGEA